MMAGHVVNALVHEGFGGKKLIVECGENHHCRYIVKCQKVEQSINEFVSQTLLKIIGYSVPEARIIKLESCDNDRHGIRSFGGVEYIDDAHNLSLNYGMKKSNENKRLLYELIFIKYILNDSDEIIQIMESDSLGIFLVDLGETLISEVFLKSIITQKMNGTLWKHVNALIEQQYTLESIDKYIRHGITACLIHSADESEENKELIQKAVNNVLEKLSLIDLRKLKTCFQELKAAYGNNLAELYHELIIDLRRSIRQKLNY